MRLWRNLLRVMKSAKPIKIRARGRSWMLRMATWGRHNNRTNPVTMKVAAKRFLSVQTVILKYRSRWRAKNSAACR
ncbi:hypothetical protein AOA57_03890 [Pseudomonas sp. 2588-5]|nr:hypothetical protein B1R45_01360 [Pseudomonas azotoformans]PIB51501.1 hypothetical protein AOA57_03890 [Pseudomonas sp. 2588-5]